MEETNINENIVVVWLDANINLANNDYQKTITKLREASNIVNTFTNVEECINFIIDNNNKQVFMVSSGAFGEIIVPIVHDMPQISAIYVFCGDITHHQQWAQQWLKVKGVFNDINLISEDLKTAVQQSMSAGAAGIDTTDQNLDLLEPVFMYTQILKEILLSMNFESTQFIEFINYCREQLSNNSVDLSNINKLEHEYHQHTPIWWYTYDCFLYSMLNSALRTMDTDAIVKLGFFIRDLHEHITHLHSEQYASKDKANSFIVYYGQSLSQLDFEQLVNKSGGLLAFNNFLLTNKNRQSSLNIARGTMENSDEVGILYTMKIDSFISSIPFANIHNLSYHQNEEEILFSMHCVFRIGQVQKIDGNNRLWQVDLTLTNDNDPALHVLTEHVRNETFSHGNQWDQLGNFLLKIGQWEQAQQIFQTKVSQTNDDSEQANNYLQLASIEDMKGEYPEAIRIFIKAIQIKEKTLPPGHSELAAVYSQIGSVYEKMGDYSNALSSQEKACEIYRNSLPPNHPTLATSYDNMGSIYEKMDDYSKAFSSYEKAFEIYRNSLPPNHPTLAASYNNMGSIYENMGEYSKAVSAYEKALEILQESLPPGHPNLAASYNKMGSVYEKMGDYSKAFSSYEKALEIYQYSLPSNHPDLQLCKHNIENIKKKL